VIDLCDYYILVLGFRYGSVNDATGKSYTEMEYDYAISKGIPVLVFTIDDNSAVEDAKWETDDIKKGKLIEFKSRAMRNRLASIWKEPNELYLKVAISIMQAKQEIKRPGWQRGGNNQLELLQQVVDLKTENEKLKLQLEKYISASETPSFENTDVGFYGIKIRLHYTEQVYVFTADTVIKEQDIEVTLDEIFKFISLRLTGEHKNDEFIDAVSAFVKGYYVDEQDALILKNHYIQLGLFDTKVVKGVEIINLTEKGKKIMNQLNSIK
jgi:hypothetical protein